MEAYIFIVKRYGIYEFSGIGFNESEAQSWKSENPHSIILKEEIDESCLTNNQIFVAGAYDLNENLHDYRGICYSFSEAKSITGSHGHIVKYTLPDAQGVLLED